MIAAGSTLPPLPAELVMLLEVVVALLDVVVEDSLLEPPAVALLLAAPDPEFGGLLAG